MRSATAQGRGSDNRDAAPGGLPPDDISILRAIKESIPDANSKTPQEVLSFVAEAVRAHSAKTISALPSADTEEKS